MKKLIIILLLSFALSADYITPIFYQLGADDSQIGHFMVGKTAADFCEDSLKWQWWESGLTVLSVGILKESIDEWQVKNSYNPRDLLWTCYGWVFKRFLTFRWEF